MPQLPNCHICQRRFSILGILMAVPWLFATTVYGIPAAAAAPTPTTYTVTKISSTTLTTSSPVLHISPHILELITTMTVTTYEPWPTFLLPSPEPELERGEEPWSMTVLEEVVSSVTWIERRRYLERDEGTNVEEKVEGTTVTSFVVTMENTWVVHPAGPTNIYLPATVGEVGCGGCGMAQSSASISGKSQAKGREAREDEERSRSSRADMAGVKEAQVLEDPTCLSSNLTTGCQGQCLWKPPLPPSLSPDTSSPAEGTGTGTFWCLHLHPYLYPDPSLRMGRACWGSYLRYRQLSKPCLVGDVGMACLPCVNGGDEAVGGRDHSWDAVFWEGEE